MMPPAPKTIDLRVAIARFLDKRPFLLVVLYGLAMLCGAVILIWFFIFSPYSGPPEFIYNQF
ncbi:MAG: hypothetical protein LBU07_05430 [Coriobacteriales bacterium]|jgi:hypothetical protein|nr:hypothetical protein [Coriobacteriales bacterium]